MIVEGLAICPWNYLAEVLLGMFKITICNGKCGNRLTLQVTGIAQCIMKGKALKSRARCIVQGGIKATRKSFGKPLRLGVSYRPLQVKD